MMILKINGHQNQVSFVYNFLFISFESDFSGGGKTDYYGHCDRQETLNRKYTQSKFN